MGNDVSRYVNVDFPYADAMVPGRIYSVWFTVPADKHGNSIYRSAFTDEFVALDLDDMQQLLLRFMKNDPVDVRHVTKIVEAT